MRFRNLTLINLDILDSLDEFLEFASAFAREQQGGTISETTTIRTNGIE